MTNESLLAINANYEEKYGFNVEEKSLYKLSGKLTEDVVRKISKIKNQPEWIRITVLRLDMSPFNRTTASPFLIFFSNIPFHLSSCSFCE